jgi:hypothetical protein
VVPDDRWTAELGFVDLSAQRRMQTIEDIKALIQTLGERHPEVFDQEPISAEDYQEELKPAIFSLGGTLRQEHGASNEDTVRRVFLDPAQDSGWLDYTDQRSEERIDFKGRLTETDEVFAMDVKGGEGQSIGHLLVPTNADILTVWSERNARNTKSPPSRLNEVINRVVRWGFNQSEDVALMVIRDPPAGARTDEDEVIPDVVVFPEYFPTPEEPEPPMRDLDDLHFLEVLFGTLIGEDSLYSDEVQKHIWFHKLEVEERSGKQIVTKEIHNAYDDELTLTTRNIDFSRISDVL